MFEVGVYEMTTWMAIVTFLLYSFAFLCSIHDCYSGAYLHRSRLSDIWWLFFFIVFALTYTIGSDFFHYKEAIETGNYLGLEDVYHYIIETTNQNYFLFRLIVFGSGIVLCNQIFGLYDLNKGNTLLLLLICFGCSYSYARASLAFTIYFLGYSILSKSYNSWFKCCIGLTILLSSYFFHRSMLLLILITPFGFLKVEKRTIILICLSFPFVVLFIESILANFSETIFVDNEIAGKVSYYSSMENGLSNWKGIISKVLSYSVYVISVCFVSKYVLNKKLRQEIPMPIYRMYTLLVMIITVAVIMFVVMGNKEVFFIRYLRMSMIPLTVIMSFLLKERLLKRNAFVLLLIISGFSNYLEFLGVLF